MLHSFSFCEKWIYEESFFNVVALLLSDEEGRLFRAKQLPAFFTNNGKLKGEFSDKLWCDFGGNFRDQFQHKPARETPSRLAIPNFSKKSRCAWETNKQTL